MICVFIVIDCDLSLPSSLEIELGHPAVLPEKFCNFF